MTPLISGELATMAMVALIAAIALCSIGVLLWDAIKPDPRVYCDRDIPTDDGTPDQLWLPTSKDDQ